MAPLHRDHGHPALLGRAGVDEHGPVPPDDPDGLVDVPGHGEDRVVEVDDLLHRGAADALPGRDLVEGPQGGGVGHQDHALLGDAVEDVVDVVLLELERGVEYGDVRASQAHEPAPADLRGAAVHVDRDAGDPGGEVDGVAVAGDRVHLTLYPREDLRGLLRGAHVGDVAEAHDELRPAVADRLVDPVDDGRVLMQVREHEELHARRLRGPYLTVARGGRAGGEWRGGGDSNPRVLSNIRLAV